MVTARQVRATRQRREDIRSSRFKLGRRFGATVFGSRPWLWSTYLVLAMVVTSAVIAGAMWSQHGERPATWGFKTRSFSSIVLEQRDDGSIHSFSEAELTGFGSSLPQSTVAMIDLDLVESVHYHTIDDPAANLTGTTKIRGGLVTTSSTDRSIPVYKRSRLVIRYRVLSDFSEPPQTIERHQLPPGTWKEVETRVCDATDTANQSRFLRAVRSSDAQFIEPYWPGVQFCARYYFRAWRWVIAAVVALVFSPFVFRIARIVRRRARNWCLRCGYDRRGITNESVCPECGWDGAMEPH